MRWLHRSPSSFAGQLFVVGCLLAVGIGSIVCTGQSSFIAGFAVMNVENLK